ncbi:hypothetical protein HMPREF6485_2789 [Segatella buccae ATCC 33574]|uniref:Uncharacterized protein n=1 Tax=Segatella buccae ATCC 33574 TaxID=873513 RepID=E6KB02_9BACT|nr:hypothetical protein HMPREF6485_2789 [Segatella buccae ATCC 33574]
MLVISRLNFIDTELGIKMGFNGPKRNCKRATVASQLWPVLFPTAALLQVRRARIRKPVDF